jgi:hypothetical protein
MKTICGSFGTSTYIASAQHVRSTMPMTICNSVKGPLGSCTCQFCRPMMRGVRQTQANYEASTIKAMMPKVRLTHSGSWSMSEAACGW